MNTIYIKVSRGEFTAAKSGGCAYGTILDRRPKLYCYAELGPEVDYLPKPDESSSTDRRRFRKCTVEADETESVYEYEGSIRFSEVDVVLYC